MKKEKSIKWVMFYMLILMLVLAACQPTQSAEEPAAGGETEAEAVEEPASGGETEAEVVAENEATEAVDIMSLLNSDEVNKAALASDYSQAMLADSTTVVDTSVFEKEGPYRIAVSQQDASNGWGNTYNVSILSYGEELLADGVLAEPLITSDYK